MKYMIIAQLTLVVGVGLGWVLNIISLVDAGFEAGVTVELALRLIGIPVVPLGAVMGYFV